MAEENYRCAQKLDLSHPEILESSAICSLLKQRGLAEDVLKAASRTEQLNLYYKIVLPLPQRQYRDNRRGKLFGRKNTTSSEKTVSSSPKEKPNASSEKSEPSIIKLSRLVNLPKLSNTESPRLKPPPITINSERKTIKLSCKREFSGSALVTSKSNNPQTTEQESGRKIIRLINDTLQSNIRHSKDKRKSDSLFARKSKDVVNLNKGNGCRLTGNNLSSKKVEILSEESSAEESPKKKHRPITWP